MRLVFHRRSEVLEFVTSRIKYPLNFDGVAFEAVGAENRQGDLRAGCLLYHFKPVLGGHDIEVSFAAGSAFYAPGVLRDLFMFAFWTLGGVRVNATVAKAHKRARKATEQLGFKQEGVSKWGLGYRKTAILYGMTFPDCPWIDADDKIMIEQRLQEMRDDQPAVCA